MRYPNSPFKEPGGDKWLDRPCTVSDQFKAGQQIKKVIVEPRHAPASHNDVYVTKVCLPSIRLAGNRA